MNADLILTTSVPAMIEARETIREKVMGAFVLLNESMSLEKTASMEQYSVLESFMSSGRGYYFTLSNPGESTDSAMCYVFRYLSRRTAFYPTVIRRDLENVFL